MKKLVLAAASLVCMLPAVAMSAEPAAVMDLYYVLSPEFDLEVDGDGEVTVDEGDGLGVKGRFNLTPLFFVAAEYQANEYDEVEGFALDTEFSQIRGGLGIRFGADSPFYVLGEAVNFDLESDGVGGDDTGFGVHLGANAPASDTFSVYGQVGYLDVGDVDGIEFLVGAAFMITPQFGAFVDYRNTSQEDDGVEATFKDIRLGLRISLK
ncbi:MAG: outer membrane beta-barrel protein [Panacagrimonas sp.]